MSSSSERGGATNGNPEGPPPDQYNSKPTRIGHATEAADAEFLIRANIHRPKWGQNAFGNNSKTTSCGLEGRFAETSKAFEWVDTAHVLKDKEALLAIDALPVRARTRTALKAIIEHASGLVKFYPDVRKEAECELAAEHSAVLISGYLESLAGGSVP